MYRPPIFPCDQHILLEKNGKELSEFSKNDISNKYVAKVKPGKHSLVIPLGAKAHLTIYDKLLENLSPGNYELTLTDISGLTWSETIII
ncbi:MAG: TQO small subunit DoxA domain-containing protein [Ginsengibacter sp.]|jgi:thiosulfate dehydrogenase [quinone] large subunit